jgi:hypothetical protein
LSLTVLFLGMVSYHDAEQRLCEELQSCSGNCCNLKCAQC